MTCAATAAAAAAAAAEVKHLNRTYFEPMSQTGHTGGLRWHLVKKDPSLQRCHNISS
jgi:hypothetical protein